MFWKKEYKTGALIDNRSNQLKERDYIFEEIVSAPEPINWVSKKLSEWRKFPIFDQGKSNACVAFSMAKVLGIMHQVNKNEWLTFSPGFIYNQRINKPDSGMYAYDSWKIVRKNGCLIEELFPSQRKTDEYFDNYLVENYKKEIASVFKIKNYINLPLGDIETIASTIQKTKKGIMVWFYFTANEWFREKPIIKYPDLKMENALKHSVVAVDFTLYENKKALIIEDSSGPNTGINGQRIITEDFFFKRNFYSAYPINFIFETQKIEKPSYQFNNDLHFGMINNPEVSMLQKCLQYLGYFPLNVETTGNYFEITRKAIYQFQKDYKVSDLNEIESFQGKIVGPKTRLILNSIFK